jgi:hypothetical protein
VNARSGALLFATLLGSPPLFAQEAPGTVPLEFSGDAPDLEFEVRVPHEKERLTCKAPCTLSVSPGRYTVRMRGRGVAGTKSEVDVLGPTSINAETGSGGARTTGLVIGIAGAAAALIGLTAYLLSDPCLINECHADKPEPNRTPWLVVMGVGAVTSVVGWVMFGNNASSLKVSSAPRVSVSPTSGGASLSLSATF